MNRIRHAAPDWALDSMQMAAVFAQLHLGYKNRRIFSGGPRSCLTPISAGILLISIGAIISQAQAQTISLPSTTTTVTLQTLSPGSTTFDAPAGTVINASSGNGVEGNNAQNWVFTNHGSITGAVGGVSLSSATLNGVTLDNFSTIKGNGSKGLSLTNGGQLNNHVGATIAGAADGVQINGAGSALSNAGSITAGSNSFSAVYFDAGGTFTQSATGTVGTNGGTGYGVVFNSGSVAGANAGIIYGASTTYAFWTRSTATGAFSNSGTFSAGTGAVLASSGVTLTNTGTITGTGGTAVSLTGSGNTLILGTGSVLNGNATSTGANNVLTLQGSGSAGNNLTGFSTLNMYGTAWTLGGANSTTGTTAAATNVQSGILTLTGALTNGGAGGGTTIASGATLQVGNGGTTGSVTGNLIDNGTLSFNRSDSVTFANVISGTGSAKQAGTGTTILTGANTYTGGTTIAAGTLQIGNGGTAGSITGDITDNAVLAFNRSDVVTYGGVVSGSGSLTQQGSGTLVLTGDNTYTGGTAVNAGNLQLGNGGTTGSVSGDIADNAALTFNHSGSTTYGGVVSGSGSLTQQGSGALVLTGNNTYTGGTTINAGTLQLGNGGTTGGVLGDIIDNTALVFDRSNTTTYGGVVSGAGTLTQQGSGTTTLTGASTYTGGTTINAGTLQLTGAGAIGSGQVNLAGAGTLLINNPASGNFTFTNALTGSGILQAILGNSTNTFTLGNTVGSAFTGTIAIGGGTFMLDSNAQSAMPGTTLRLDTGGWPRSTPIARLATSPSTEARSRSRPPALSPTASSPLSTWTWRPAARWPSASPATSRFTRYLRNPHCSTRTTTSCSNSSRPLARSAAPVPSSRSPNSTAPRLLLRRTSHSAKMAWSSPSPVTTTPPMSWLAPTPAYGLAMTSCNSTCKPARRWN